MRGLSRTERSQSGISYNGREKPAMPLTIAQLKAIDPSKIVVFDTETTGLNKRDNDEAVSLAMVDGNGKVLFDTLLKPEHRRTWKDAERIHGITPADVKDAPKLSSIIDQVKSYLDNAELVVGYNLQYDIGILRVPVAKAKQFDVMLEFATFYGEKWPSGERKWSKLTECAAHYHYTYPPHGALEDTKATLHCFNSLLDDVHYKPAQRVLNATGRAISSAQKSVTQAASSTKKQESREPAAEQKPVFQTVSKQNPIVKFLWMLGAIVSLLCGLFFLFTTVLGVVNRDQLLQNGLGAYLFTIALFAGLTVLFIKLFLVLKAKAKK